MAEMSELVFKHSDLETRSHETLNQVFMPLLDMEDIEVFASCAFCRWVASFFLQDPREFSQVTRGPESNQSIVPQDEQSCSQISVPLDHVQEKPRSFFLE